MKSLFVLKPHFHISYANVKHSLGCLEVSVEVTLHLLSPSSKWLLQEFSY